MKPKTESRFWIKTLIKAQHKPIGLQKKAIVYIYISSPNAGDYYHRQPRRRPERKWLRITNRTTSTILILFRNSPTNLGRSTHSFVSGLPDDVRAREIHNLFRRRPGFESCQLKYTGRGDQVVAFATFSSHGFAMAAMNELNGVKFDPQTGSTLHIEVARSNSRRKERPGSGPYVVIDNRNKEPSKSQDDQSGEGESDPDEAEEPGNSNSPKGNDSTKSEVDSDQDSKAPPTSGHLEKASEGGSGARPCSTLFIANLGPNCTEDELKQLLSSYPGFNILKIRARGGMPVAFADFEEIEQATYVMNDIQGNLLSSSDRGGMHIEYARSKMRKQ